MNEIGTSGDILIVGGRIGGLTLVLELHGRSGPISIRSHRFGDQRRGAGALSERYKRVAGYDKGSLQK
jgi:hypothetical protein